MHLSLFIFFSVLENYISLLRSNSSGNPSVLNVITGLLRQSTHSALTVESQVLCSALFVRWWLRRTFKIFSVFLPPFKIERLKPLTLVRVPLTLCLLGLSSWFWKAHMSTPLLISSYIHSEAPAVPVFFSLTCDRGLVFPNQYEQDKSACSHIFSIHL